MIIYLNKACFKPALILWSILFLPGIIACIIITIVDKDYNVLIAIAICAVLYSMFIIFSYLCSKSKKNFLQIENDKIEIAYPNINRGKHTLSLNFKDIKRFDFYTVKSLTAWISLFNGLLPRFVCITYEFEGERHEDCIGYMTCKEMKNVALLLGVEFFIH
ncbi:MAG: hypothetical protein K2L12_08315 [Clostridia bacterium]|nr:hypothetical protein [Clostridia bacterium]